MTFFISKTDFFPKVLSFTPEICGGSSYLFLQSGGLANNRKPPMVEAYSRKYSSENGDKRLNTQL